MSGDDFFWTWESLRYGSTNAALGAERPTFTRSHAESIKSKLVDELKAKRAKEQREQMNAQRRTMLMSNMVRKVARAPGSDAKAPLVATPSVSFKFPVEEERRARKCEYQECLVSGRLLITLNRPDRYMYEKISERSESSSGSLSRGPRLTFVQYWMNE